MIPKCKCGQDMVEMNVSFLPATYTFKWVCLFRKWNNFWKHTAPYPSGQEYK